MKTDPKPINPKRRRLLQGAAVFAVGGVIGPAVAGTGICLPVENAAVVSGKVVSKVDEPVKSMLLHNHSAQTVEIERFANGGVMFDGETVDCNGACVDQRLTLAPGEEKLIQFDKRALFSRSDRAGTALNMQSEVTRLHEGTRVVPFTAVVSNGVATL